MKTLRGQLLVSAPKLRDPNFVETVVFMVKHDEEGAIGLVLNRRLDITVAEATSDVNYNFPEDLPLFKGGPCDGPLMVLHNGTDNGELVIPGVRFATMASEVLEAVQFSDQSKCFAGYSGWSPGQLEKEMEAEAWLVVPASATFVFDDEVGLYDKLLTQISLKPWVEPENLPDDPSLN